MSDQGDGGVDVTIEEQGVIWHSITKAVTNLKKKGLNNLTPAILRGRLVWLNDQWGTFRRNHATICSVFTMESRKAHPYFENSAFDELENHYFDAVDFINDRLAPAATSTSTPGTSAGPRQVSGTPTFRLAPLELPEFSGNYLEWTHFRDMFDALVIKNAGISNVERLQYLKLKLTGEASSVIRNVAVTDANFTSVWDDLKARYENSRAIISALLSSLFNIPAISQEPLSGLKFLRNTSAEVLKALTNLKRPVEHWDDLLVFFLVQKLDKSSRKEWETALGEDVTYPSFARLKGFLETRIKTLEALTAAGYWSESKSVKSSARSPQVKSVQSHFTIAKLRCSFCQAEHRIYQCEAFKELSVDQRNSFVRKAHLCVNCLAKGHSVKECASRYLCSFCKRKHNSLLHVKSGTIATPAVATSKLETKPSDVIETPFESENRASTFSTSCNHSASASGFPSSILLATARVLIKTASGRSVCVRALLDQGSECSFVSETVAQILKLPRVRTNVVISGVGGGRTQTCKSSTEFTIEPSHGRGPALGVRALILHPVSSYVPKQFSLFHSSHQLRHLEYADPSPSASEKVDLLIGADLYGRILLNGLIPGDENNPTAQKTIFGWVLSGSLPASSTPPASISVHHCALEPVNETLKKFWEIENLPEQRSLTDEELACEAHFLATHSRNSEGRYVVRLPFKAPSRSMGDSKQYAFSTLTRLETRLNRDADLSDAYQSFLSEYESLGHMRALDHDASQNPSNGYLPHHPVLRKDSLTSKLRVVFNASAPSANGVSLNDRLMIGPKLQSDLSTIILRWRVHRFVFSADIAKMFRQILVHPADQPSQCILWRRSVHDPISSFALTTVTYGTASAPFLALRTISQLAQDEGENFPLARSILNNQIYVDDLLFGSDDKVLALQTKDQVVKLLSRGGFQLRKWSSNCPELLLDIDPEDHGLALDLPLREDDSLKLLGIFWSPLDDAFKFKVDFGPPSLPTKRNVLSLVARIFDPLGWLSPVVVSAKILLQSLWILKIGWDDSLPNEVISLWTNFNEQLEFISRISIPRWTNQGHEANHVEIHGFSDASNLAFSAVVYLRTVSITGDTRISILIAKSKVAPLKTLSIPKLELLGACLLTKCVIHVQTSMSLSSAPVYCWSDSQVVLDWLKKQPATWKVFVANRVAEIQTRLDAKWGHVPSNENPADCASRGIKVTELVNHPLWWEGPRWLKENSQSWPTRDCEKMPTTDLEIRVQSHSHAAVLVPEWDLLFAYSSWTRLLRITSYIIRFVKKSRKLDVMSNRLEVTPEELRNASDFWVRHVQEREFPQEWRNLSLRRPVAKNSPLYKLDPFIDEAGIIRLGGRLRLSSLTESRKHPVILPRPPRTRGDSESRIIDFKHISYRIIEEIHRDTLHGGTQLTLRVLRERFWILCARRLVKTVIHNCVRCVRERGETAVQFMSDLPPSRSSPSRTFSHTGVDYAGPFNIRLRSGRGHQSHKSWVALFVCLATRAIHLELVNDYTAAAFIAAFERFTSRRGLPSHVYSDNGTNFRGAERELWKAYRVVIRDSNLRARVASDGVSWIFSPPGAPHFGGLWEAGVKSFKHHLRRMIGASTPTIEEFNTLLCKIEACLNSRPIAPLNDDPECYDSLTPGHFLIGTSLKSVPMPSVLDCEDNRLSRWKLVSKITEQFWRAWSLDYLHSLQRRVKWSSRQSNVKLGELVLVKNPNLPPSKWELGRVLACFEGKDNLVRVVRVKTAQTELTRPITQLCRLPIHSASEQ